MTVKKQNIELCISRVSSSRRGPDGEYGYINVRLVDPISGIEFVDMEVPFKEFGSLIVNGPGVEAPTELRGLEWIGKKRVTERRSVFCPIPYSYEKEEHQQWIKDNCQEDGWIVSSYLGNRDSVTYDYKEREKGCTLHYSVYKYVDPEAA